MSWRSLTEALATAIGADVKSLTTTVTNNRNETLVWMTVVTPATDVRPSASHVIWVGGTTKPTNMAAGDLWVKG